MELLLFKPVESKDALAEIILLQEEYKGEINFTIFTATEADKIRTLFSKLSPFCFNDIAHTKYCYYFEVAFHQSNTSSTTERSFLLTRRIETWLRLTNLAKWFNSLTILYDHKTLTKNLHFRDVAYKFVSK